MNKILGEEVEYPEYNAAAMGAGIEDMPYMSKYDACRYGWDCALDKMAENGPLYTALAASPAPDGEVVYQWKRHADTAWNDSDKEECEKVALIDFLETRILYTAPPRVVDVELRNMVTAHVADLRRCADVARQHNLKNLSSEFELAATEFQTALEKP